jgi:hypothetical protein
MPGKTPMWGNPMREREREILLFSFRKVHISSNYTISSQEKNTSQHQNCPKICLDFRAQKIRTIVWIFPFQHLEIRAKIFVVQTATELPPSPTENAEMAASKSVQQAASIFVPSQPLYDGLYGSVQYGLSNNRKLNTHKTENPLGICAQKLLGNVPSLLPSFLSQAYSKILSQSPPLNVSCTLPNAFFYKSENDIFPPKCLFTFPNPKSKGQDLILPFQDQGS